MGKKESNPPPAPAPRMVDAENKPFKKECAGACCIIAIKRISDNEEGIFYFDCDDGLQWAVIKFCPYCGGMLKCPNKSKSH
ncbi:hypothetical protein LCGC14_1125920 [marine sediment metagenome]|uniref:Uncharacterized protein n=2 Tax=root TaxID=1 RepID=A0A831VQD8_9FLAO|nr:hypothetical protein [Methylophaga sp.]HEA19637.1 hypothetical protein [Pricia antarctica]